MGRRGAKFVLIAIGVLSMVAPSSALAAWGEPQPLPDSDSSRWDYARLALADNGDAIMTWITQEDDPAPGEPWLPVHTAIAPADGGPIISQTFGGAGTSCMGQLATDAKGDAAVAFQGIVDGVGGAWIVRRIPGEPFSEPEHISSAWGVPEVSMNANGEVAVFYDGFGVGDQADTPGYYASYGNPGEPMSDPVLIVPYRDREAPSSHGYDAVIGPAGDLAAIWPEWSPIDGTYAIHSAVALPGLPPLLTVAGTSDSILSCPRADSNSAGDAVAVFYRDGCGGRQSELVRRTAGTPFGDPVTLPITAPGPDQMAVDGSGTAYLTDGYTLLTVPKVGPPQSYPLSWESTALDVVGSGKGLIAIPRGGLDENGDLVARPAVAPIVDGALRQDLGEPIDGTRVNVLSIAPSGAAAAALVSVEGGGLALMRLTTWPDDPAEAAEDPDTDPPDISIRGRLERHGYVIEARCNEHCSMAGKGVWRLHGVRKRTRGSGHDVLRFRVKDTRPRALVRVSVTAEDMSGNDSTARRKVKLRS
jgi:hypothetical protein